MGCCFSSDEDKDQDSTVQQEKLKEFPLMFLEISKSGNSIGQIVIELFADVPKTAENFRALCSGELGHKFSYKGCPFHRIVPGLLCESGDIAHYDGTGERSIYGSTFEDENFIYSHSRAGMLSMANKGKDTNASQFFILTAKAPWLDGKHVVFGRVIDGMEVVWAIEQCGQPDGTPSTHIEIENCGQLSFSDDFELTNLIIQLDWLQEMVPPTNERTPLLDPSQADHIQQIQGGRASRNSISQNHKGDEQSEFTRILRQTAINVIDVTSSESQNMEQGEMQDRATQYSNRLNMVLSASGKSRALQPNLPTGITSPQMTLTAPPVSIADVQLISNISEKCSNAAKEIKIQHKESLVVTFGVP